MNDLKEVRHLPGTKVLRADGDGGETFTLEALVAVTDQWTDIYDIRERIAPGAFRRSIPKSDVVFNIDHDGNPLARSTSGTLSLKEVDDGLFARMMMDRANPRVAELESMITRGDLSEFSFAFQMSPDGQEWDGNDRTITDFRSLLDVSIVQRPAYDGTGILSARSMEEAAGIARRSSDEHRIETDIKRSQIARELLRGRR